VAQQDKAMKWMRLAWMAAAIVFLCCLDDACAQQQGKPGAFDFYLLNVVPSAQFCAIKDVGPGCKAGDGWWLHGLWPQRFDGTYPVFCAERKGPREPGRNLDQTPDLTLLQHEWAKHGTCTTLAPEAFFRAGRKAFHALVVPPKLASLDAAITLAPAEIIVAFERANPAYPRGSIIVWCSQQKLTSVSACLSKDLKPIACRGVSSCKDAAIELEPVRPSIH
jgi:ribonuclease T2